jgi:glycerophosphoryl diester phosphodiesterase
MKDRRRAASPFLKDYGWLLGPIAHRGLAGTGGVENSMEAFLHSRDLGFPIELDVQLTQDEAVVVHHDASLVRSTGKEILIAALTLAGLRERRLFGREDLMIPTLQEVLECIGGRVPLLIEVKQPTLSGVGKLERLVSHHLAGYSGSVALESFNPASVRLLKKLEPRRPVGQLSAHRFEDANPLFAFAASRLWFRSYAKPDFIAYSREGIEAKAVQSCRRRGIPVLAYTLFSQEELDRIRPYIEGYIFQDFLPMDKAPKMEYDDTL